MSRIRQADSVDLSDVIDAVEIGGPGDLSTAAFNEYMHRLVRAASEWSGGTGHSASGSGGALEVSLTRYKVQGTNGHLPDLLVARSGEQVELWALVTTDRDRLGAAIWASASEFALGGLGKQERFGWSAAIAGDLELGHETPRLLHPITVGGLHLRPLGEFVTELIPGPAPTMSGGGIVKTFWPVAIDGTSGGYAWSGVADAIAARALHQLCALMTVAMPVLWTVRDGLTPIPSAERYRSWRPPEGLDGVTESPQYVDLEVPDWIHHAERRLSSSAKLQAATLMFHEGCLLSEQHPSLALISFTAVVESVFREGQGLKRCATCGAMTGSTRRFKEAIASVMPEDVADVLSSTYSDRSRTVHNARLHGEEVHRGAMPMPTMFGAEASTAFRWVTLRYTRDAARALLVERLKPFEEHPA